VAPYIKQAHFRKAQGGKIAAGSATGVSRLAEMMKLRGR
jgi:hypothetical protein